MSLAFDSWILTFLAGVTVFAEMLRLLYVNEVSRLAFLHQYGLAWAFSGH